MKKIYLWVLLIVLFALFLFYIFKVDFTGYFSKGDNNLQIQSYDCSLPEIRCVDDAPGPNQEYSTIQACANAVNPGDTCFVYNGTYNETKVHILRGGNITGKVTFKSEGNVSMNGFYIRNKSIIIDGFEIYRYKAMWTSAIDTKDIKNVSDVTVLNNYIHGCVNILLNDTFLININSTYGEIRSSRGGFIDNGFGNGDFFHLICDYNQTGDYYNYVGNLIVRQINNNSMNVSLDYVNSPASAFSNQGPIKCRMFVSSYAIWINAENFSIVNNTVDDLCGNFVNVDGKNGVITGNDLSVANGWDIFRVFGHDYVFRNNYIHDSAAQEYIGNHPDLFQMFSQDSTTYSMNILFENNFFSNMGDYQICMFENHDNSPNIGNWTLKKNVFYNITYQANSDLYETSWIGNTFFLDGGTGGGGTVVLIGDSINSSVYNNIFLGTGADRTSYSWYNGNVSAGFYADYNYVANSPPGFAKKDELCLGHGLEYLKVDEFCEGNGINGGDPALINVDDIIGNDGIAFTNDDGLIPLSNSFLCYAGKDGETIGAYECQGCTITNPIAYFSLDNNVGYSPLSILFNASNSLSCAGTIVNYSWNMGDGTYESGEVVNHSYLEGNYVINLTITNDLGKVSSYKKSIIVYPSLVPFLVLYIPFNNNSVDVSGRDHNVAWYGNESYSVGRFQGAAEFSINASNYVEVLHDSDLDGMDKITLSVWARKNTPNETEEIVLKHIIYRLSLTSNQITGYLSTSGNGIEYFSFNVNNTDTNWHHYALSYGGSLIKMYFDGYYVGNVSANGNVNSANDRYIQIGKDPWGESFNGSIDDFRLYEEALTASDIFDLYNGSFVVECGDLIIQTGEECDDGNIVNGDGCSSICHIESSQNQNTDFISGSGGGSSGGSGGGSRDSVNKNNSNDGNIIDNIVDWINEEDSGGGNIDVGEEKPKNDSINGKVIVRVLIVILIVSVFAIGTIILIILFKDKISKTIN